MTKWKKTLLISLVLIFIFSLKVFSIEEKVSFSDMAIKYENELTAVGIDVSYYQGDIDWKKVASSGVKFAIIRCGYRGNSQGTIVKDKKFDKNITEAIKNKIPVGVYFYSTAINETEAIQEAKTVVNWVKDYELKYFIAYDFEDFNTADGRRTEGLSQEQINKNAKAFLNYIKNSGYRAVLYGSSYYLNDFWNMTEFTEFDTWVAHYNVSRPSYKGKYQMWQCTSNGSVPGIIGNVDVDIDYNYYKDIANEVQIIDDTVKENQIANNVTIKYRAHARDIGWLNFVEEGKIAGTTGESRRLEALNIELVNNSIGGGILYKSHIRDIGWEQDFKKDGQMTGTTGQSLRMEGVQIKLYGEISEIFDIYYRVHIRNYGWLDWAKNGESAGSEGLCLRMEAIEIRLVEKGESAPGSTLRAFLK